MWNKSQELKVLHQVGKAVVSSLEIEEVLKRIMEHISTLFSAKDWSMILVDEEEGYLYFGLSVGGSSGKLVGQRLERGEGVAGWVIENRIPTVVEDASKDPRFSSRMDRMTDFQTGSIMAAPLVFKGEVLGAIELVSAKDGEPYTNSQLELLELFADYAAVALANARTYEKLARLTVSDECTGLYNSRHLHVVLDDELRRFRRYSRPFSLLFFDLDRFKRVNDTHGHLIGTELLKEVGELLRSNLRDVDLAFRYGGDEFVVLFPETPKAGAVTASKRLWRLIREHVFLKDKKMDLRLTSSMGVASVPGDGLQAEEVLKAADEAMYKAKESGRDAVFVQGIGLVARSDEYKGSGECRHIAKGL